MPYKDPEKQREYDRKYKRGWIEKNKEKYDKYISEWRNNNREKVNGYGRKHYWLNREKEINRIMSGNRKRYRRQRIEAIEHYGAKCECCNEDRIQFLCIDHKNGGGTNHKKELWAKHITIYEWLIKNNFPEGFRLLCHNCNMSIGFYGFCPHQFERGELSEEDIFKIDLGMHEKRKHDRNKSKRDT